MSEQSTGETSGVFATKNDQNQWEWSIPSMGISLTFHQTPKFPDKSINGMCDPSVMVRMPSRKFDHRNKRKFRPAHLYSWEWTWVDIPGEDHEWIPINLKDFGAYQKMTTDSGNAPFKKNAMLTETYESLWTMNPYPWVYQ